MLEVFCRSPESRCGLGGAFVFSTPLVVRTALNASVNIEPIILPSLAPPAVGVMHHFA